MNKMLQAFARQELKTGLACCTPGQVLMFRRMYIQLGINAVVDAMLEDKLDRAMEQVQQTLDRLERGVNDR